jgi:hypothetical protein
VTRRRAQVNLRSLLKPSSGFPQENAEGGLGDRSAADNGSYRSLPLGDGDAMLSPVVPRCHAEPDLEQVPRRQPERTRNGAGPELGIAQIRLDQSLGLK